MYRGNRIKYILDCNRIYDISGALHLKENRAITPKELLHIKDILSKETYLSSYTLRMFHDLYFGGYEKFVKDLIEDVLNFKFQLKERRNFLNGIIEYFAANGDAVAKSWILHKQAPSVLHKYLLNYDFSFDEEVLILRSLNSYSYGFNQDKLKEYAVNKDALAKLPPVMRLKTIKALFLIGDRGKTNLLRNIKEDDLDLMLAPVMLKYTSDVSHIKSRFKEINCTDTLGEASININCNNCGNIKATLHSNIKSEYSFKKTRMYRKLGSNCPICGRWSKGNRIEING